MNLSGPIFLTGFMATGKSKLGRMLALRLGRVLLDTDQLVELRADKSIARIFAEDGEERFRQLERDAVATAARRADAVVSLGGGAITREENWRLMNDAGGVVVCLVADVETILQRVSRKESRPLLAGLSLEEKRQKICQLLAERAPFYRRADLEFTTDEARTPEAAVEQLIDSLEQWIATYRSET